MMQKKKTIIKKRKKRKKQRKIKIKKIKNQKIPKEQNLQEGRGPLKKKKEIRKIRTRKRMS